MRDSTSAAPETGPKVGEMICLKETTKKNSYEYFYEQFKAKKKKTNKITAVLFN